MTFPMRYRLKRRTPRRWVASIAITALIIGATSCTQNPKVSVPHEVSLSELVTTPDPPIPPPVCTTSTGPDGKLYGSCSASQYIRVPCELCDQLKKSSVAYNTPKRMSYQDDETIELVLAPETSAIVPSTKLGADLNGDVRTISNLPYSIRMQAEISGPDFQISPSGPQERTILPDRATKWAWNVRPTAFGPDRVLILQISAILDFQGKPLPPANPIIVREKIFVHVGIMDRAVHVAQNMTVMHGAIASIGGTGLAVLTWVWARVRRQRPKPDDQNV
ncbi:Hypothetical protein NGAL_HAMBI1189_44020 [Neorhizobium galegae bv. officinalis]|uniref:Uncharacterized protein n=1 Tax=Neorhizobium galegae bv. officinalis TaxID=323656 RepID=A0A0T7GYJ0_NEOGA|nr:Hypothetical protein NGAL_HAMBI1189_44020 [Neorhizobium galegae bv. officinalis]